MRIGIVGAGAIGGWIAARLSQAGHAVSVLARGATLEAVRRNGVILEAGEERVVAEVAASDDAAALGEQDVVVIAVKGPSLPALAPRLVPMIGAQTTVVPAMNGVPWWFLFGGAGELAPAALVSVDPQGHIASAIPFEQVVGCVVHASSTVVSSGVVKVKAGNRLIIGSPHGGGQHEGKAADMLAGAGFDVERSSSIQSDIWYKLWGNMTMNPISAITGATCDRILDDPLVRAWAVAIMNEAQAVGARIGCGIDEDAEARNAVTRKLGVFKTSMLQDAEAGREMEIDQLLAAPREIARMLGQATPSLDALLGVTRLFAESRRLQGGAA